MDEERPERIAASNVDRLAGIGVVAIGVVVVFLYVGGWLSPSRLTPNRMIAGFEASNGNQPGFRRNHAKGICATGWFDSNGNASSILKAALFRAGRYPVVARLAFSGGMPFVANDDSTVRSVALRFMPTGQEELRTGMVNIPVFPFKTAQAFYDQMVATTPDPKTSKVDPPKMQTFSGEHPEFGAALEIIGARTVSSGFGDATYNSLDTFTFVDANGESTPARWAAVPVAAVSSEPSETKQDSNALFDAFILLVLTHQVQWHLVITLGGPDGHTDDPTLPWSATRKQIDAGIVSLDRLTTYRARTADLVLT
ncbi:catalase [Paraburkholderia sediminicola]|uniref:catalase n=1 Tax=Paraburkholderia sediminicola TaxID=458836 RepID=UPI0038BC97AF